MAQERPDIEYPCNWEFRIIGADEAGLREAIAGIVGNQNHEIRPGHTQRGLDQYPSHPVGLG